MYFRNQRKGGNVVSISDSIDTDKDGRTLTLQDIMSDEDNIFDRIDLRLKAEHMYGYIESSLNDREKDIITLRYGLFGKKPLTQREVAKLMGISRSYVSRIEKKAIGTLQRQFLRDGYI